MINNIFKFSGITEEQSNQALPTAEVSQPHDEQIQQLPAEPKLHEEHQPESIRPIQQQSQEQQEVVSEISYIVDDSSLVVFHDKDYFVYRPIEEGADGLEVDFKASYYALKDGYATEKLGLVNSIITHENEVKRLTGDNGRLKDLVVTLTQKVISLENGGDSTKGQYQLASTAQSVASIASTTQSVASTSGVGSKSVLSDDSDKSLFVPLPKRKKRQHYPYVMDTKCDDSQTYPEVK